MTPQVITRSSFTRGSNITETGWLYRISVYFVYNPTYKDVQISLFVHVLNVLNSRMSNFGIKKVRLEPNRTNMRLLKIWFQYILAWRVEMYWNLILKSPRSVLFGHYLTHYYPKSDIDVSMQAASMWDSVIQYSVTSQIAIRWLVSDEWWRMLITFLNGSEAIHRRSNRSYRRPYCCQGCPIWLPNWGKIGPKLDKSGTF